MTLQEGDAFERTILLQNGAQTREKAAPIFAVTVCEDKFMMFKRRTTVVEYDTLPGQAIRDKDAIV